MKAITARYYPATSLHPARIRATDDDGSQVYVSWEEATAKAKEQTGSSEVEHRYDYAVKMLCQKLHWRGTLTRGYLRISTYVYCWQEYQSSLTV